MIGATMSSDAGAIVAAGAIAAAAAVGSSALTAWVSYRVQSRANQNQDQRDAQAYKRQVERDTKEHGRDIRRATADRLRDCYLQVLKAADAIEYASKRTGFLLGGETEEERDLEVNGVLRAAMTPLPETIARLRLETDTQDIISLWESNYSSFVQLQTAWAMNRQAPGAVKAANMRDLLSEVEGGLNWIIEAARKHLEALSQPI